MTLPICELCEENILESTDNPVRDESGSLYCSEECLEKTHGCDIGEVEYEPVSVDEILNDYT